MFLNISLTRAMSTAAVWFTLRCCLSFDTIISRCSFGLNAPGTGTLPLTCPAELAYAPCTGGVWLLCGEPMSGTLFVGFGTPAEGGPSSLALMLFCFLFWGERALIDTVSPTGVGPFGCDVRWAGPGWGPAPLLLDNILLLLVSFSQPTIIEVLAGVYLPPPRCWSGGSLAASLPRQLGLSVLVSNIKLTCSMPLSLPASSWSLPLPLEGAGVGFWLLAEGGGVAYGFETVPHPGFPPLPLPRPERIPLPYCRICIPRPTPRLLSLPPLPRPPPPLGVSRGAWIARAWVA